MFFGEPADVTLDVFNDLAIGTSGNVEESIEAAFDGETSLKPH